MAQEPLKKNSMEALCNSSKIYLFPASLPLDDYRRSEIKVASRWLSCAILPIVSASSMLPLKLPFWHLRRFPGPPFLTHGVEPCVDLAISVVSNQSLRIRIIFFTAVALPA